MPLLLEDTGSPGKLGRMVQYLNDNVAAGLILSPMKTPRQPRERAATATTCVTDIHDAGGEALWDPCTHVAMMPLATELGPYDEWDLWPGPGHDLADPAVRDEHVERCLARQLGELGTPPIAPTVAVAGAHTDSAQIAMALAETAVQKHPGVGLHLVGTPEFLAEGRALDDYVGALAQLAPARWLVSVMRPDTTYPVPIGAPGEVEGLCRTVYSLAFSAEVVVRHGDLAGLSALAGGGTTLASGWHLNQRILARAGYQAPGRGRGAIERILCRGLFGVLRAVEVADLTAAAGPLMDALIPGPAPVGQSAQWDHHLGHLAEMAARITLNPDVPARSRELLRAYTAATRNFHDVGLLANLQFGGDRWVEPFRHGLHAFMVGEGWPTS